MMTVNINKYIFDDCGTCSASPDVGLLKPMSSRLVVAYIQNKAPSQPTVRLAVRPPSCVKPPSVPSLPDVTVGGQKPKLIRTRVQMWFKHIQLTRALVSSAPRIKEIRREAFQPSTPPACKPPGPSPARPRSSRGFMSASTTNGRSRDRPNSSYSQKPMSLRATAAKVTYPAEYSNLNHKRGTKGKGE
ncbi:hypothetical protein CDEST_00216 [Colletotrichum destructivum]|uniref:Uncharacterized protein n=1 Tax=Colletotrichum destructivum TaxID=34406 RepID=A0AAX4HVV2_9PEZI|nr:hypothetical protein CDEST_00216 [Colletotrichum destructivum]